jgi:hypothetical protein
MTWTQLNPTGPLPSDRYFAVCSKIPLSYSPSAPVPDAYIVGGRGRNNFELGDYYNLQWTTPGTEEWQPYGFFLNAPHSHYGGSLTFIGAIFFGFDYVGGISNGTLSSDEYIISPAPWAQPTDLSPITTTLSPLRAFAAADSRCAFATLPGTIIQVMVCVPYLFGGKGQLNPLGDILTSGWQPDGPAGPARYGHTAVMDNSGKLIVFGGDSQDSGIILPFSWGSTRELNIVPFTKSYTPGSLGGYPIVLGNSIDRTITNNNGNTIYIDQPVNVTLGVPFSYSLGNEFLNDTWIYDTNTHTWSKPAISGSPPVPMRYQSAIYDSTKNRVVIFGGDTAYDLSNYVYYLDLNTMTWVQVNPSGIPPAPRFGHCAVYDPTNQRMLIFGGNTDMIDNPNPQNDLWQLNLDKY